MYYLNIILQTIQKASNLKIHMSNNVSFASENIKKITYTVFPTKLTFINSCISYMSSILTVIHFT